MIETREVKAAATAQLENLAVACTWPAANSLGPAKKVKAAQGKLHAQLLLALHSQSISKGERSPGHIQRGKWELVTHVSYPQLSLSA